MARNKSEEFVRKAASNYTGNYTPNQTSEKDLHQGSLHLPRLSQTNRANHERGLKFTETKGEKTQEREIRELKIWKWKKKTPKPHVSYTQRKGNQVNRRKTNPKEKRVEVNRKQRQDSTQRRRRHGDQPDQAMGVHGAERRKRGRETGRESRSSPWRAGAAAGARGRRATSGACCCSGAAAGPGPGAWPRSAPTRTARTPPRRPAAPARAPRRRPTPPRRWPWWPWRSPSRRRRHGRGRRWRSAASPAAAGTPTGKDRTCRRPASPSSRFRGGKIPEIPALASPIQEAGFGGGRGGEEGDERSSSRGGRQAGSGAAGAAAMAGKKETKILYLFWYRRFCTKGLLVQGILFQSSLD